MTRVLVAFYSRSGTTRKVARQIATALDADVLAITDLQPRTGALGFMRSVVEAMRARLPPIGPVRLDLLDYDLVVLGTPVWAGHLSSPMRRFLHDHGRELSSTAFFCTMAGNSPAHAFTDMRELLDRDPLATCAIGTKEVSGNALDAALSAFVGRLDQVLDLPSPPRGTTPGEPRHVGL